MDTHGWIVRTFLTKLAIPNVARLVVSEARMRKERVLFKILRLLSISFHKLGKSDTTEKHRDTAFNLKCLGVSKH